MTTDNAIRIFAGTLVLTSLALARYVDTRWLLLAAFVGLNLIQSALTGFCPAAMILERFGVTRSCAGGGCGNSPQSK